MKIPYQVSFDRLVSMLLKKRFLIRAISRSIRKPGHREHPFFISLIATIAVFALAQPNLAQDKP
ncbi:MAG: hypothetical protein KKG09_07485, partial [Verrucomicrobia bacterium]|nr:hypothetical protein [Verrucomicrobiota bacterium]